MLGATSSTTFLEISTSTSGVVDSLIEDMEDMEKYTGLCSELQLQLHNYIDNDSVADTK